MCHMHVCVNCMCLCHCALSWSTFITFHTIQVVFYFFLVNDKLILPHCGYYMRLISLKQTQKLNELVWQIPVIIWDYLNSLGFILSSFLGKEIFLVWFWSSAIANQPQQMDQYLKSLLWDVNGTCWQFVDTLNGQRNYWPKANKSKKKGEALLLFISQSITQIIPGR